METWVIKLTGHEEINGAIVPLAFEGLWRLKNGDFIYAWFSILEIEYNKPEKFGISQLLLKKKKISTVNIQIKFLLPGTIDFILY